MTIRIRKLRIVLRFLRRYCRLGKAERPAHPIPSIDPEEFSNLLRSGCKKDLKVLAEKMSSRRKSRA
jgi:hypothetical protein